MTGEGAPAHYREVDLDTGEIISERKPEYCTMSRMPGIGYDWYNRFGWTDCHLHDFVVVNGKEVRPPKYYDRLFKDKQPEEYEELRQRRIEQMEDPIINYDKRMDDLWVSEEIKIKKLERLVRNL